MNKKVLIISSSPRKGGNSETLAAAFAKGAREAGHQVETVYLREKQVGFCKGCLACLKLGHCVIQDDAVEIAAKMHDANVLVFATPVYYYCVSGQLKTMLDRANPLFDTDYAFTKAYLLAAAAEDAPETFAGTEKAVQGRVDCFPRCALAGTVFAGGVCFVNRKSSKSEGKFPTFRSGNPHYPKETCREFSFFPLSSRKESSIHCFLPNRVIRVRLCQRLPERFAFNVLSFDSAPAPG